MEPIHYMGILSRGGADVHYAGFSYDHLRCDSVRTDPLKQARSLFNRKLIDLLIC